MSRHFYVYLVAEALFLAFVGSTFLPILDFSAGLGWYPTVSIAKLIVVSWVLYCVSDTVSELIQADQRARNTSGTAIRDLLKGNSEQESNASISPMATLVDPQNLSNYSIRTALRVINITNILIQIVTGLYLVLAQVSSL